MGNPPVVVALLLVRVVVGITMIMHGYNHWRGGGKIAGTGRWFSGLGLRYGELQAWMSVVTEIGAGALLVLGFLTPLAGAAIISVMLVAGLLAHRKNGFFVFKDGYEYVLLIAVVCLMLGALGPGHFSVDYAAGIQVTGWAGAGIALGVAVVATAGLLATFYRPAPKPAPAAAEAPASATPASATTGVSEAAETSETAEALVPHTPGFSHRGHPSADDCAAIGHVRKPACSTGGRPATRLCWGSGRDWGRLEIT